MKENKKKAISMMTMAMMTATAVASIRSLPAMVPYGWASIFLYIVPAIFFMVPTALISAELASAWKGGVFVWVKESYGERMGFTAIWLQWMQNVVWYPAQLAFFASCLAYVFDQNLANSGLFTAVVILVVYWISTLVAFRGVETFAKIGSKGFIIGTIIPAVALVVFAVAYFISSHQSALPPVTVSNFFPEWTGVGSIVLVVSNFLAYAGMEMNAVHVNDMDNPRKNFPRSIWVSTIITLFIFIIPTLAISVAVPEDKVNLTQGVLQAFEVFFTKLHMPWATPILALLIVIGIVASVVVWIPGPSRGLLLVGKDGFLPPWLQKTNKQGMQVNIMFVQGIIVTILSAFFAFSSSVQNIFWLLSAMAIQLYLIMYVLMFMAGLKLRKTRPEVKRGYVSPAIRTVSWIGIIASLLAFLIGFIVPEGAGESQLWYTVTLVIGIIVLGVPPLIIYSLRKESWFNKDAVESTVIEEN